MKVFARTVAGIALVIAMAGIASAQMEGGTKGKGDPSMSKDMAKPHIIATVTGLTKENAPEAEKALKALQYKDAEGNSVPAAAKVSFQLEKNALHLTVAPGCSLKLSEIEKALEPTKVKIDRNSLGLETACVVKVSSKTEADDGAVKEAIADAKIFENFEVKPTKESTTLEVNIQKSNSKTNCGAFTKALSGAGEYSLADITWTCPAAKNEKHDKGEKDDHGDHGKDKPAKPQG